MSGRVRAMALLAVALLALAPAADAAAPTLAEITARLRVATQYDDPAAHVTPAQRAAIDAVIATARAHSGKKSNCLLCKNAIRVAILSAAPPDAPGATAARRLRTRLALTGTVIVALPKSVQVASVDVAGRRLARVRAAVVGKGGVAGASAALTTLAALTAPAKTTTTPTTTPTKTKAGKGIATWIYIAIAIVVIVIAAALAALRARTSRVRRRGGGSLIAGARALLQGRLEGLGEGLAATAVGVSEREDRPLTDHHRDAASIVADVRASIGRLDGPPAFRSAHAKLDEAEWHLGVVQAHLDGSGEPPRPESGHPARCFFNADHGLGSVEIELEVPGVRTVSVGICAADAVRLSRGDEPEVGAVAVGRRSLPWAAAPTWYGGWGWGQDDLPALRYHGQPVFTSRSQLDAFSDSGSSPRSITVRPAPSEPAASSDPSSLEIEAPVARFIPDEPELGEPAPDPELAEVDEGLLSEHKPEPEHADEAEGEKPEP